MNEEDFNEEGFEILKNIAKELLFSGSDRDIQNKEKKTVSDIFEANVKFFSEDEVNKIRYILSKP